MDVETTLKMTIELIVIKVSTKEQKVLEHDCDFAAGHAQVDNIIL